MSGRASKWLSSAGAEYAWVVLLLVVLCLAQAYLAWADSETVDEPRHVVAALAYTRNGTFRLYNVNPPLPRLVQGIFLLFVPLDTSMIDDPPQHGQRIEALVAEMFLQVHLDRYRLILFLARLGTVAFALLGGVLLFAWGNSAFG